MWVVDGFVGESNSVLTAVDDITKTGSFCEVRINGIGIAIRVCSRITWDSTVSVELIYARDDCACGVGVG